MKSFIALLFAFQTWQVLPSAPPPPNLTFEGDLLSVARYSTEERWTVRGPDGKTPLKKDEIVTLKLGGSGVQAKVLTVQTNYYSNGDERYVFSVSRNLPSLTKVGVTPPNPFTWWSSQPQ